jgi:hypothetical protein
MEELNPAALKDLPTIMTDFIREPTFSFKTFAQLADIFARDRAALEVGSDPSDDLRILAFQRDMLNGTWTTPIVLGREEDGRVGDGIHRGIAYVRCLEQGTDPSRLPRLLIAAIGSWQWPSGLKQWLLDRQAFESAGQPPVTI